MTYLLPHVRQPIAGPGGTATAPWYAWFGRLEDAVTAGTLSGDAATAAIRAICTALGSPDGSVEGIPPQAGLSIAGNLSVRVEGSSGTYALALLNDQADPTSRSYYGTDGAGVCGWQSIASALAAGAGVTLAVDSGTGLVTIAATGTETHNRIDAAGDIRVAADGSLRITT